MSLCFVILPQHVQELSLHAQYIQRPLGVYKAKAANMAAPRTAPATSSRDPEFPVTVDGELDVLDGGFDAPFDGVVGLPAVETVEGSNVEVKLLMIVLPVESVVVIGITVIVGAEAGKVEV